MFSLPHVDAELFGDEADDVGREHFHVGPHAHRLQFFQERLAPTHQGLCGYARTLGQLLFAHCSHKTILLTVSNYYTFNG